MCDACQNTARQFERAAAQIPGFDTFVTTVRAEQHREQYNLGFDEAMAKDDVIFERVAGQFEGIETRLRDLLAQGDVQALSPTTLQDLTRVAMLVHNLPRSLRGA